MLYLIGYRIEADIEFKMSCRKYKFTTKLTQEKDILICVPNWEYM